MNKFGALSGWLPILEIAIVAVLIIVVFRFVFLYKTLTFPYRKKEFLFSKAENRFFLQLNEILSPRFFVFGKVRISDAIDVIGGVIDKKRLIAFNRISRKHFDYVVCDHSSRILCVLELDDSSHSRRDRKKRDKFVDKVCEAAKIQIIHVPIRVANDKHAIRQLLDPVLGFNNQKPNGKQNA